MTATTPGNEKQKLPRKRKHWKAKQAMPVGRPFVTGEARSKAAQRKGGQVTSLVRRKYREPFGGSMLDMMDLVGMVDPSWAAWRTFWRSVFALGLPAGKGTPDHPTRYSQHTGRKEPPSVPVSEAWAVVGRRGGKSRQAALLALFKGISFDCKQRLAVGEFAVVPVIAVDHKQARAVFRYLQGFCEVPFFKQYIHSIKSESVVLHTGVDIEVHTASYRSVRGYTIVSVILDEVAFWAFEADSLNADVEIVDAVRPGLVDDGLLFGISSPYAMRGELWEVYQRYYAKDDPHILVWCSDTLSMHPTYPKWRVERAYEQDPLAAASEFGSDGRVEFRKDVELFVDPMAVQAVTVEGRRELAPVPGVSYVAFTDPSGGARDSFALAIAHRVGNGAVLDCAREIRPPFSPDSAVEQFASLLASYGVYEITGDRFGGVWPIEVFKTHGITYLSSERTKSELYRELLAPLNSARVELLDLPVLRSQLIGLERRVGRSGKDSIDHKPHGKDDLINAVAGALGLALPHGSGVKKKKQVQWSLGGGESYGGVGKPTTATTTALEKEGALQEIAAQYKERGLEDPCKAPGSVTTRHFYKHPKTPQWWTPGAPVHSDSAGPDFRGATGGGS